LTTLLIDNIGALLTGDVAAPLSSATSLSIEDGRIAKLGPTGEADVHIDAGDGIVCPGLWDAHHVAFFGDYAPLTESRGYLERTVRCGVTTVVSVGALDVPGRPKDALSATQLAILSARSWVVDRPLNIKVLAGTLIATDGLTQAHLAEAAAAGVRRLAFLEPVPRAAILAELARAQHFVIVADAPFALEVQADLVLGANGTRGHGGLVDDDLRKLVDRADATVVLATTGSLRRAVELARRLPLERLALGIATPDAMGTQPGGVLMLLGLLVAFAGLSLDKAIALATGNAARGFRQPGGLLREGEPADILIASQQDDRLLIDTVVADGEVMSGPCA